MKKHNANHSDFIISMKGMDEMQAFEFYAKPQNGVIIIPDQYKNRISDDVFVIVMDKKYWSVNQKNIGVKNKADLLSPPSLKTKGWKFNREEANER